MTLPTEEILLPILRDHGIRLYLRREDMIHPLLSGNKFRKLKYNVEEALKLKCKILLTYGGAYSNHIPATAYAASQHGLDSIGIIRGEELEDSWKENPTLATAAEMGMDFNFVSREEYRRRDDSGYQEEVLQQYRHAYFIPEGGTNTLGVKGCEEIVLPGDSNYDVLCCSVGTGGTLAGISRAAYSHQKVIGFPALRGDFLDKEIRKYTDKENWSVSTSYHFGGYARVSVELIEFINNFKAETGIPLDPVYTGKMMFGLLDMVTRGEFEKGSKILAIHTGGLQGIKGMNGILKKKNLPLLTI